MRKARFIRATLKIGFFSGLHTFYPNFASGTGAAPFKTMANYEDNLSRHDDYIAITDRSIAKFREGMESGVVETKLTIGNVIAQLDTQLAVPIEESQFMGPTTMYPDDFSAEDKARLTAAYRAKTEEIYAAHERLRDFLRDEYLPVAREQVGLSAMKGGDKLYEQLIESTTTLPLRCATAQRTPATTARTTGSARSSPWRSRPSRRPLLPRRSPRPWTASRRSRS